MKLGIECFLQEKKWQRLAHGKRVALLAHPASVDHRLNHSLDLLSKIKFFRLSAAFGPQHGIKGDKQDNMIETEDFIDPALNIPIFSLYGSVRRPTPEMLKHFDVLLVDLQDVGTRIYTFVTTLLYVLQECAKAQKTVIILDRPNPIGRPIEGLTLLPGWESFVGAAPIPMRHGLTLGELAKWFKAHFGLDLDLHIVAMKNYKIDQKPFFGWPSNELTWINPSPNAPNVMMARAFPGTVMIEGTTLSEGRGTTRPLEIAGAPDFDAKSILSVMKKMSPEWLSGCLLREIYFEPTFHKHEKKLCNGIMIHTEIADYYSHLKFKPFRLMALLFKSLKQLEPGYDLWRNFEYEYEKDRLAIDLLAGGPTLREWVDDPSQKPKDLEHRLKKDETAWAKERKKYLLY